MTVSTSAGGGGHSASWDSFQGTRLGIGFRAVVSIQKYQATCDACGSSRGDTLYLLVGENEVEAMIRFGYRREEPRWSDPRPE